MGIMAHRSIHTRHLTPTPLTRVDEDHLMNVVASTPIRSGDDHAITDRSSDLFSPSVTSWTTEWCSTGAIIAKDVLLAP